jgi:protein-disulfide isomerase
MKSLNIKRFFIIIPITILFLGVFQIQAQTVKTVKTSDKTKTEKEAIEKIVREYILKNPAIIREALIALQAQEEKEKQQALANNMKELKSEIYADADSPEAGNPKGDVTIVVFFDYFCGYCRKTLPELKTLLAKDASIRVIYKEIPIMGEQSQVAARAALAAGRQGKYEEFHHALMEADGSDEATIKGISEKLGLNFAQLKKDMDDTKLNESIERNLRLATAIGVDGTPAYIVGEQIIPGAIDAGSLAKIVEIERSKLAGTKSTKTKTETK